jgi:hypothetical protein
MNGWQKVGNEHLKCKGLKLKERDPKGRKIPEK